MSSIQSSLKSFTIQLFNVVSLNTIVVFLLITLIYPKCIAQMQDSSSISFFTPSRSLNKPRLLISSGFGVTAYSGFAIGLNQAWYANYPRSGFHFFNDIDEWRQMDKYAHIYNTYFQCRLGYQGAKWTGLKERSSLIVGLGMGMLFQTTIEVLDGFSSNWGFSNWDMVFNILGASTFLVQQHFWDEQKISIKLSAYPFKYPDFIIQNGNRSISLQDRANSLYGSSIPSRVLKDYNAINIWASMNIESLVGPQQGIPAWLNLAVGIGANNLYGGFENKWEEDGIMYEVPQELFPRYNQYFIGLDIDWTRIKTDHAYLKTLFKIINIFKFPSPTMELTSRGDLRWHWLYF